MVKVIEPSFEILAYTQDMEKLIELAARNCYKSEDKICEGSAEKMIAKLIDSKHDSVLEHSVITVRIVCDRGVSHELVRHRIASYSQESTRYANYSHDKFGNEIAVIKPCFWEEGSVNYMYWEVACRDAEDHYMNLLNLKASPQEARSVLPNSLKTEIVMTANIREWRTILKQRTAPNAHPQMAEIMVPLSYEFNRRWPSLFSEYIDRSNTLIN